MPHGPLQIGGVASKAKTRLSDLKGATVKSIAIVALAAVMLGACVPDDEASIERSPGAADRPAVTPAAPSGPVCHQGQCETSVSGTGSRVVDLEIKGGGFCTITSTVRGNTNGYGGTNFIVQMVHPNLGLWANEITSAGTYQTIERFQQGSGAVVVEVDAEGSWTVAADCRG